MQITIEVDDTLARVEGLLEALEKQAPVLAKRLTDPPRREPADLRNTYRNTEEKRPALYRVFKNMAQELRDRHQRLRFGANAIVEAMRWSALLDDQVAPELVAELDEETGEFRVCNGLGAFWARRLVEEDPSYVEFFSWGESMADEVFPVAAALIAKQRLGNGSDAPVQPQPPPAQSYDGARYYDLEIRPFVERFGPAG